MNGQDILKAMDARFTVAGLDSGSSVLWMLDAPTFTTARLNHLFAAK